jgi:tetratricopeptide (TPR) repeat protein
MLRRAVALQQEVAGSGSLAHARATLELGIVEHRAGDMELADSLYQTAQSWLGSIMGARSADASRVQVHRAQLAKHQGRFPEADSLYADARDALQTAGAPLTELLLIDLERLEVIHGVAGGSARADSIYARIVADPSHLESERLVTLAKGMLALGMQQSYARDWERAEPLIHGALELRRQVYGETHSDVALALSELSEVQWNLGRRDEALAMAQAAVDMLRQTVGAEHPEYAMRLGALGVKLGWFGELEAAVTHFREVERIQAATLGEEHFHLAVTRRNLGRGLMLLGRFHDALPAFRAGLTTWIAAMGDRDFYPPQARLDIATALFEVGQHESADSLLSTVLDLYRADPPRGTMLGDALVVQARFRAAGGSYAECVELVRSALTDYDNRDLAVDNLARATAQSELGGCLIGLGELPTAEEHLLEAHRTFMTQRGQMSEPTRTARDRLARLYRAWDRPLDAARFAPDRS